MVTIIVKRTRWLIKNYFKEHSSQFDFHLFDQRNGYVFEMYIKPTFRCSLLLFYKTQTKPNKKFIFKGISELTLSIVDVPMKAKKKCIIKFKCGVSFRFDCSCSIFYFNYLCFISERFFFPFNKEPSFFRCKIVNQKHSQANICHLPLAQTFIWIFFKSIAFVYHIIFQIRFKSRQTNLFVYKRGAYLISYLV